jgi:hypothetical protein
MVYLILVLTHILLYAINNPKKTIYVSTDQLHMGCNIGGLRGSPIPTVIQRSMVVFNLQNSKKLSTRRRPMHIFYVTIVLRHFSSIESIAMFLWIVGCPQAFKQVETRLGHCVKFTWSIRWRSLSRKERWGASQWKHRQVLDSPIFN